jgi:hypothetical protein
MLEKSYILNFIIDAKFYIKTNICYFCLGTGRSSVSLSLATKETLIEIRGGKFLTG